MDPDLPLARALQAGDASALDELIRRHQAALLGFVFKYLRDETAARDIVQETFVRTFFKASKFEPKASFKTWIFSIALNLTRDRIRRLGVRRGEFSMEAGSSSNPRGIDFADAGLSPDVQAGRKDDFEALQSAIDKLPSKLREPLVLCQLDGQSHKEASEILGVTKKSVELRIFRAKARLRELLAPTLELKQQRIRN